MYEKLRKGKRIFSLTKNILFFSRLSIAIASIFFSKNVLAESIFIGPGPDAHERLQEALILMNEGDTLVIESGYYEFEDGLSLDVSNVTIKGEGMEKTILDFKNQQSGAQGFLVTSD